MTWEMDSVCQMISMLCQNDQMMKMKMMMTKNKVIGLKSRSVLETMNAATTTGTWQNKWRRTTTKNACDQERNVKTQARLSYEGRQAALYDGWTCVCLARRISKARGRPNACLKRRGWWSDGRSGVRCLRTIQNGLVGGE